MISRSASAKRSALVETLAPPIRETALMFGFPGTLPLALAASNAAFVPDDSLAFVFSEQGH